MIRRLLVRIKFLLAHGKELNRRVEVENILFSVAAGKREPLTVQQHRILALKLGTPVEWQSDKLKQDIKDNF